MLELLRIKNFILIEEQEIQFDSGLNVFTGETGAGKSIILQALNLILGARPKPGLIRKGAECWEIEALFDLSKIPSNVLESLPAIVENDDSQLLLYRSAGQNGRSKCLINGRLATVSILEEIARHLIHMCGQGAFLSLLEPKNHLAVLDSFAGVDTELINYKQCFQRYSEKKQELHQRRQRMENSALRRAELEYIVEELSGAKIEPGKRASLQTMVEDMGSAETRIARAGNIEELIVRDGGLLDQMGDLKKAIQELAGKSGRVDEALSLGTSIIAELSELSAFVNKYVQDIEVDSNELEQRRDELAEIARLERKFHLTDTELSALLLKSKQELEELDCVESLSQLESEFSKLQKELSKKANQLNTVRREKVGELCSLVSSEFGDLNMPDASLSVAFEECEPGEQGTLRAEFLVVTNAGLEPGPLRQIASGGELSRILLVMKKVLRDTTGVNVLVFDEVDSGVSGKVARAMGEKLKSLAEDSQVLCITHLAQVASLADAHFIVRKDSANSVETTIERLTDELIVDEIARMLAGYQITDISRASARELLAS